MVAKTKDIVLAIATAPRKNSKFWDAGEISWGEFLGRVLDPADHKECGNYVLGTLKGRERKKGDVVSRSAIALDADYAGDRLVDDVMASGFVAIIHTTYNSAPDEPRYRIIIPLSESVGPEEYGRIARSLMRRWGAHQFDDSCDEPNRFMYWPSAADIDNYEYHVSGAEARLLDPSTILETDDGVDWKAPKPNSSKRDPFEIEGAVGAFNRVFSIAEAIKRFELPYEQVEEDRWHLNGARSVAGLSIVSPGLVYSHHAKDPAHGMTLSAFDLVRVHRFGDADDAAPTTTPFNRLPSHGLMLEFAAGISEVEAEIAKQIFKDNDLDPQAGEDNSWRDKIRVSARTGNMVDSIANWDLIVDNDIAFRGLQYNELTMTIEVRTDLPWRKVKPGEEAFTKTDRSALNLHLERVYKIRPSRPLIDELVDTKASKNKINPVRDYLETLVWDGKKRVEEALPGVTPTPYTRMVAKKCLTAAVARMMSPGIKWDHTLILMGDEGLGKSWWIERLFLGQMATLGNITNKDTLLVMHRSWVMVADEGYSLKKADADAMKEFLTRSTDVFRAPYDKEVLAHKRHSVIWGTTNDPVFLRRQAGNRRFLVVHSEDRVDFEAMTDEYIAQVWAEAKFYYENGEKLFLSPEENELAALERETYIEESAIEGLIRQYLDTRVPEDWDEMSPDARRMWMSNRSDGLEKEGILRIDRVCTLQIWVEVLGKNAGDHKRTDLLEISQVLRQLPGWTALPGRRRVPGYGVQMVFAREEKGI